MFHHTFSRSFYPKLPSKDPRELESKCGLRRKSGKFRLSRTLWHQREMCANIILSIPFPRTCGVTFTVYCDRVPSKCYFIIFIASRRDEVAGIRAKFPSKIPVIILLIVFPEIASDSWHTSVP